MKALLWLVTASIAWISIWLWILATQTSAYLQERGWIVPRSEEHTSELQSRLHLVCRLLLEKKKTTHKTVQVAFGGERYPCTAATSTRTTHPTSPSQHVGDADRRCFTPRSQMSYRRRDSAPR